MVHNQVTDSVLKLNATLIWRVTKLSLSFFSCGRWRQILLSIDLCNCCGHSIHTKEGKVYYLVSTWTDSFDELLLAWSNSLGHWVLPRPGPGGPSLVSWELLVDFFNPQLVMCCMRIQLFLDMLPFTAKYRLWYRWLPILILQCLLSSWWRVHLLLIQITFSDIQAPPVPFGLPMPRQMAVLFWHQAQEWAVTGLHMVSFQICQPELVLTISLALLESNQSLFLP